MKSCRSIVGAWRPYATVWWALALGLCQALVAEEGLTAPRYYPKFPRPRGLRGDEKLYLDWVQETLIPGFVAEANTHMRRFRVTACVAAVCAVASPSAYVAGLPKWAAALFGFFAAAAAALEMTLKDQQQGVAKHRMAVDLQRSVRELSSDSGDPRDPEEMHRRFPEFRRRIERIKKYRGAQVLKIMEEPPPRVRIHKPGD